MRPSKGPRKALRVWSANRNGGAIQKERRETAMKKQPKRSPAIEPNHRQSARMTVGAAVFLALYGLPHAAFSQQVAASAAAPAAASGELEEVTVTANRRQQNLEEVPYSLSVVSAEQLERTGVTDIASLASQVPGLSLYDYGARLTGATTPIIRGINATSEPRGFRTFEQNPVGTYVGNSPIDGYFQLDDLKQVEVLRGPPGTLYGAGALGGALRLIPNSPELDKFTGSIEASGGRLAHSSGTSYIVDGMINIPVADTLAFRVSAKYAYEPGFISVYGLLKRSNDGVTGVPLLANPGDVANSPPIYSSRDDWNYQKTFTGRAAALWKPIDGFSAELAILHSNVQGDGGPVINANFPGGVSPFDPQSTLPAGGHYQEFSQIDQPFSRYTNLLSLDLSYDVGFATLSSTSSYFTTTGSTLEDATYQLASDGATEGAYLPYYAGTPTNPRFVYDQLFVDKAHTFSQEVRLVSNTNPDNLFDYVGGVFYEEQERTGNWTIATPGSPERSGLTSGVNDVDFVQIDHQSFTDKSVFGELTWHAIKHGQVTFGVRHFQQDFTDAQSYDDYAFPTHLPAIPHSSPASKTIGKVDLSYEYTDHQFVYALWSQGFRRGGANSVPLDGIFKESPSLASYQPDKTNNYEGGFKGRFSSGLSYTFSVFDIKWDKPQISQSLPSGNLAVFNGNTAESKGVEIETSGPLFLPGLGYSLGWSYADARLTSDFSLPANNGSGTIVDGLLTGKSGQQLPGSPKNSATVNLTYDRGLMPGYDLSLLLNGTYRSAIKLGISPALGYVTPPASQSFLAMNFSATLTHKPWRVTGYIQNLTDKQEILVPAQNPNRVGGLSNDQVVNMPREVGVRAAYTF
jgi:outer membrane receptor protein involved in Fe transport